MIRRAAAAAWLAVAAAACGHAIFVPPAGPGTATDASAAWAVATAPCRAAQSYSGNLRISGRAGSQRIWHLDVETAVTPRQIYMGATFSRQPIFILAGTTSEATLWLRPEQRVVKGPAGDIIEAILGLSMPPDRLLSLLTGCGTRIYDVTSAQSFGGLLAIQTPDARVYVERQGTVWRTRAAEAEGFRVEFSWTAAALPGKLWIRSTPGREPAASLDLSVSDASATDPIPSSVFTPPSGAAGADPMTLEELRSGSWRKKS
jgi:hypothetical protein